MSNTWLGDCMGIPSAVGIHQDIGLLPADRQLIQCFQKPGDCVECVSIKRCAKGWKMDIVQGWVWCNVVQCSLNILNIFFLHVSTVLSMWISGMWCHAAWWMCTNIRGKYVVCSVDGGNICLWNTLHICHTKWYHIPDDSNFEITLHICHTTWYHIPDDSNLQNTPTHLPH